MDGYSYLNSLNLHTVEELYQQYLKNPETLAPEWRRFFEGFDFAQASPAPKQQSFCAHCLEHEFHVINLIEAYRRRGHLFTKTNPVRVRRTYLPTLDLEHFGLNAAQLEMKFRAGELIGIGFASLRQIIEHLQLTYCGSVGCEYIYARSTEETEWLQQRIETGRNRTVFKAEEKLHIFRELARAVLFEQFLMRTFLGQKSFSLEGAEALVPALHLLLHYGSALGAEEFQIGMAHRGRLNVLAHILEKPVAQIFSEFAAKAPPEDLRLGDVKYHKGFANSFKLDGGQTITVSLAPNPSHLEVVSAVVEGVTKAKLLQRHHGARDRIVPLIIHGDAAVAAEGVVYEVVQMAGLPAYDTGGTLHIVINNQIGFTTNYLEARSSIYCTDVAKVTSAPVFHVNADDVEAVAHVMRLAMDYRQRFHKDVFIDLLGYRRRGHNEADEPKYTQPLLYRAIEAHPSVLEIYERRLLQESPALKPELERIAGEVQKALRLALSEAKKAPPSSAHAPSLQEYQDRRDPQPRDFTRSPDTGAAAEALNEVMRALITVPRGFVLFEKTARLCEKRAQDYFNGRFMDWPTAELAAFGTLLSEGHPVRLCGQDVERGTFSQRHAVLLREDSEERYVPLSAAASGGARFTVHNSLLSEAGALGFEFGYSLAEPQGLTVWEAQFGDFVNNAQAIIDNFVCCSRTRWQAASGLVLLLPHGYEGQGAEHSSARIERFLQLCACLNMQVVYPSTPANYFHVLRRQLHRPFRLPLIVMTPKSLLRHPECISYAEEFRSGGFREVIPDPEVSLQEARKVVLCSGKIFYDLRAERAKRAFKGVALVRVEQLYPWPEEQINGLAQSCAAGIRWVWAQEEPLNMGAWTYVQPRLQALRIEVAARPEADTPATGYYGRHQDEQRTLIEKALEVQAES